MAVIDAHIHLSTISSFASTAKQHSLVDYTYQGLIREMDQNDIDLAVGMGVREFEGGEGFPDSSPNTPMGLDLIPAKEKGRRTAECVGINPYRVGRRNMPALEAALLEPYTVGIKIYLGYYPFYAFDDVYAPVYDLAASFDLPVVFHTGDTFSTRGLLKYAHPLTIDEVAVKHPRNRFVMAHLGDPWMLDAAEVLYKNPNVFADLSGLMVGDTQELKRIRSTPHFFDHFKHALAFCDRPDKLMFGTDWPLTPIAPYMDFIDHHVPAGSRNDIFGDTALHVFSKLKCLIRK
ncbi:amidohydrolase family protein [Salisediminibacterium beveridgei]|uniref:Amidohydrolase n=1 Tax=Salisediminibacterium beveridgei TaxID=632773 RepID=A0A1D7QVM6_9BACI|nr:amidohydrolase family protein [Salisediminibacterium beveridgei]AOM83057.1 amidohydrolase [Salisediminibacterium beveridgei]